MCVQLRGSWQKVPCRICRGIRCRDAALFRCNCVLIGVSPRHDLTRDTWNVYGAEQDVPATGFILTCVGSEPQET